jgi:hypothetical protein
MSIEIKLVFENDGGLFASTDLAKLLSRIETAARRSSISVVRQLGNETGLSLAVVDAVSWRLWTLQDGLFWIETIEPGSLNIKGTIMSATIAMLLTSTIGESIKDGWKETKSHHYIAEAVPKIEDYFIKYFEKLLDDKDQIPDNDIAITRVMIIHDERGKNYGLMLKQRDGSNTNRRIDSRCSFGFASGFRGPP